MTISRLYPNIADDAGPKTPPLSGTSAIDATDDGATSRKRAGCPFSVGADAMDKKTPMTTRVYDATPAPKAHEGSGRCHASSRFTAEPSPESRNQPTVESKYGVRATASVAVLEKSHRATAATTHTTRSSVSSRAAVGVPSDSISIAMCGPLKKWQRTGWRHSARTTSRWQMALQAYTIVTTVKTTRPAHQKNQFKLTRKSSPSASFANWARDRHSHRIEWPARPSAMPMDVLGKRRSHEGSSVLPLRMASWLRRTRDCAGKLAVQDVCTHKLGVRQRRNRQTCASTARVVAQRLAVAAAPRRAVRVCCPRPEVRRGHDRCHGYAMHISRGAFTKDCSTKSSTAKTNASVSHAARHTFAS
eukprot:scaffold57267_cov71-Phaeocystis_antarctica.AAC.5